MLQALAHHTVPDGFGQAMDVRVGIKVLVQWKSTLLAWDA